MRARNIKPGFFKNEKLAEFKPLTRILFAGLWCLADRDGRLEYRPKRIKAEVLPYDDVKVEPMIADLVTSGFVTAYESGGNKYLEINQFKKHQHCHIREAASTIPAPCLHEASTGQAPDEHGTSTPESPILNTESPILKADDTPPVETGSKGSASLSSKCQSQEIVNLYHAILPELPKVVKLTDHRRKQLAARWQENSEHRSLEWWTGFFKKVRASPFLMGLKTDWRSDLEWLTKEANFYKVLEGKYEDAATDLQAGQRHGDGRRYDTGSRGNNQLDRETDERANEINRKLQEARKQVAAKGCPAGQGQGVT